MPSKSHRAALTAGVVAIAAVVAAVALHTSRSPDTSRAEEPAAARTTPAPEAALPTWGAQPGLPVEVGGDLWVGGEQVLIDNDAGSHRKIRLCRQFDVGQNAYADDHEIGCDRPAVA